MPTKHSEQEIFGRLMLWHSAITETRSLLTLAIRASNATKQENIVWEHKRYTEALSNFEKVVQVDAEVPSKSHHRAAFVKVYEQPFPTLPECYSIKDATIMLSVVIFSQIFNIGYAAPGAAVKTDKRFVEEHFQEIIRRVFGSEAELKKFEELLESIKTARDKMLAHADAEHFEIKHHPKISSQKLHRTSILDIDIVYWHSTLRPLELALLHYQSELTGNGAEPNNRLEGDQPKC